MSNSKGYKAIPLSMNRKAVIASVGATAGKQSAIHSMTEVDISIPRKQMKEIHEESGNKVSLTAYVVSCLGNTLKEYPEFNSFIKGRKLVVLDDVTISVLIDRELDVERIPEPIGIKGCQNKPVQKIQEELRAAKEKQSNSIGSLSDKTWVKLIPRFVFKTFIRFADKNIHFAKVYGKIAVSSVGMFSKQPLWFIPHGSATVMVTVGSINNKVVEIDGKFESREHLCLTLSFDHNIIDGAPAARFMNDFCECIGSGELLNLN